MTPAQGSPPASATPISDSVGMAVIAAGRVAQQIFETELDRLGLTMRHLGALGHLAANPDLSISDLARRSGVTAQSMHATVRGLEQRGAVHTEEQRRGRPARLSVTDQGRDLLNQAQRATSRLDAELAQRLGQQDLATLRSLLAPMTRTGRG